MRPSKMPAFLAISLFAFVQTAGAAPPERYDVQLRYRINASRNQRISQFLAMTRYLEGLGFNKNPGEETEAEDPTETRMTGSISASAARKLLSEPHVRALLLIPAGYALPKDAKALVKVQLDLASGLPADRQRVLEDQVRARLAPLGFREAIGYDNRGHTRLLGWIPRGELETLLGDLRWQSSGALTPAAPVANLPSPIKNVSPVLVTEVLPEPAENAPATEPAACVRRGRRTSFLKSVRELRELASATTAAKPVRMEIILSVTPRFGDSAWQNELTRIAPGLVVEGRLGSIVTVIADPRSAPRPRSIAVGLRHPAAARELVGVTSVRRIANHHGTPCGRPAWINSMRVADEAKVSVWR